MDRDALPFPLAAGYATLAMNGAKGGATKYLCLQYLNYARWTSQQFSCNLPRSPETQWFLQIGLAWFEVQADLCRVTKASNYDELASEVQRPLDATGIPEILAPGGDLATISITATRGGHDYPQLLSEVFWARCVFFWFLMKLAKINAIATNGLLCLVGSLNLNLQDIRLDCAHYASISCGCSLTSQVTLLNETVHWGIKALEGFGGFEHTFL